MQSLDLEPWPHGDRSRTAALRGLVRIGLAEAVRTAAGEHYRLLPLRTDALTLGFDAASDLAVRA